MIFKFCYENIFGGDLKWKVSSKCGTTIWRRMDRYIPRKKWDSESISNTS